VIAGRLCGTVGNGSTGVDKTEIRAQKYPSSSKVASSDLGADLCHSIYVSSVTHNPGIEQSGRESSIKMWLLSVCTSIREVLSFIASSC